jgi:hypothetical protein
MLNNYQQCYNKTMDIFLLIPGLFHETIWSITLLGPMYSTAYHEDIKIYIKATDS